jgi:hypothetical protein
VIAVRGKLRRLPVVSNIYQYHDNYVLHMFLNIKCGVNSMDLFPNEQNFDLDKSRQKFHHGLKEHHKISNIPKFRCEML